MKNKNKKCSVYGCKKDSFAKGMCRLHYARVRRSGITKLIRKIVNYNSDTHGEKNKYHNRGYIDKHICTDCGILLTKKNTYRNAFKHKQYRCKVCTRKRSRDFHRIHLIGVSGEDH